MLTNNNNNTRITDRESITNTLEHRYCVPSPRAKSECTLYLDSKDVPGIEIQLKSGDRDVRSVKKEMIENTHTQTLKHTPGTRHPCQRRKSS